MTNKEKIEKFYKDVEALDLKFPVATIAEKTRFSKGNVSVYLSRKKEPSDSFIERFYKEFPESSTKVPRGTTAAELDVVLSRIEIRSLIQTLADVSASNKILAESTRELVITNRHLAGVSSNASGSASLHDQHSDVNKRKDIEEVHLSGINKLHSQEAQKKGRKKDIV